MDAEGQGDVEPVKGMLAQAARGHGDTWARMVGVRK